MIAVYIIAYLFLCSFFLIERFVRKGDDAKTLKKTEYDKGSTNLLGLTFVMACLILLATPILNYFEIGTVYMYIGFNVLGLLLMLGGISLRIVAVVTLGKFYMRTLRKTEDHEIVSNGVYKYLRHPGYSGNILLFIGASVAMGNVLSFVVITGIVLSAYIYRIKVEEKMLITIFGAKYELYSKKTKRLIPFIY